MFNDVKGNDNSTIMIHVDFVHSLLPARTSAFTVHRHTHTHALSHAYTTHICRMYAVHRPSKKRERLLFSPFNGFNATRNTSSANHPISPSYDNVGLFLWFFGIGPDKRVCVRVCLGIILDCTELCDNDHNG